MIQLTKTFDPVKLSFLRSVLTDEGIDFVVLDTGAGGIWPSAIPARLMVDEKDAYRARRAMAAAGIEEEKD
ncbi:MAG TPA: DUF2007 domain-containing protein [Caulobacteraceae bacterium]|jgi:hypothetical protein|nr:DUF2007 domain-containing protein [Caulobacteraceae bacterium]